MIPDKIIYTDGHDVVVTETMLKVKSSPYSLNGITKHGLSIIKPNRAPGYVLMFLGIILACIGLLQLISPTSIPDVHIGTKWMTANTLALILGGLFFIVGILIVALMRERYAVRIATAEGEKDVIVSTKKEYVAQIINALNDAFNFVHVKVSSYSE